MLKPLIDKRPVGTFNAYYTMRRWFHFRELLAQLPEEMLAAKKQVGAEVECYGQFWCSYSGQLQFSLIRPDGITQAVYMWNDTDKQWAVDHEYRT
jgi:hypothetical protein